ncbi:MAG: thioredoxin [Clostridia bacterium]|nr:thioredoxin [Oscillospiraceae bacterium]MBR6694443.1 thioredoxin [Clostridia bacterium]
MNYVNSSNFNTEVLQSEKTVLLDFYADWCGPCQMLSPILEEIAAERADIKVCKVDVDSDPQLAMQFGINSIPALFVFKGGRITNQSLGLRSKADIINML